MTTTTTREHIDQNGQFQSDKYPWCLPGFVPLKLTDPTAWKPLWDYAQERRKIDPSFANDLEWAIRNAGLTPEQEKVWEDQATRAQNLSS